MSARSATRTEPDALETNYGSQRLLLTIPVKIEKVVLDKLSSRVVSPKKIRPNVKRPLQMNLSVSATTYKQQQAAQSKFSRCNFGGFEPSGFLTQF